MPGREMSDGRIAEARAVEEERRLLDAARDGVRDAMHALVEFRLRCSLDYKDERTEKREWETLRLLCAIGLQLTAAYNGYGIGGVFELQSATDIARTKRGEMDDLVRDLIWVKRHEMLGGLNEPADGCAKDNRR